MSDKKLEEVELDVIEGVTGGCHPGGQAFSGEGGYNKSAAEALYAQIQGQQRRSRLMGLVAQFRRRPGGHDPGRQPTGTTREPGDGTGTVT
jgi:hypothetical protein